MRQFDIGVGTGRDKNRLFDTPTLIEVWRTGPFLLDGRATDMGQVLIQCNSQDKHGTTANLNDDQINDLIMYILSL